MLVLADHLQIDDQRSLLQQQPLSLLMLALQPLLLGQIQPVVLADQLMTLHSPQIMGFSRIPIDQLSGVPAICDYYAHSVDLNDAVAAAPDISRAKVTESYAERLGLPLVVMDKRQDEQGRVWVHGVIGDVGGRDVIFLDDEIVTGASVAEGAAAVSARGARRVFAGCVHATLSVETTARLTESQIERLAITDTIPLDPATGSSKIQVCSVADLFGRAIRAIHDETSISALYR